MTTFELDAASPDSSTKLTLDPGTNPVPVIVKGVPPTSGVVLGDVEMEVTAGTVGLHCQLSCVVLCPQYP